MKLIKSSWEILEQDSTIESVYKHIELCGRTCYKSQDKITEDSAKPFVDRMISSKHYAMLEHGTVYLMCSTDCCQGDARNIPLFKYSRNKYSRYSEHNWNAYVTTNLRVIAENNWWSDLMYICEPTEYHAKRYTVKFICDIGVQREFCRHRIFSFANESTRYCNYSKDRFNNELTFIIPPFINIKEGSYNVENTQIWDNSSEEDKFLYYLSFIEASYLEMVTAGYKPQEARSILPLATKSELIMTGFSDDWEHFFRLRSDIAETGKPHPQAEELATPLREEFVKRGYIKNLKDNNYARMAH